MKKFRVLIVYYSNACSYTYNYGLAVVVAVILVCVYYTSDLRYS